MPEEKKAKRASTVKARKPVVKKTTKSKVPSSDPKVFTAGDKMCYCYVSVNLTSNTRHGSIISIGAMDSVGNTFYGETTDYNIKDVNGETFEKVIKYLCGPNNVDFKPVVGTIGEVRDRFIEWLKNTYQPINRYVQFVMDKVCWDWPIFKEFIAPEGFEYPNWISSIVIDLNSDLANAISVNQSDYKDVTMGKGGMINFIPAMSVEKEIDRIEIAESSNNIIGTIMIANDDNALKKAMSIRAVHQSLWGFDRIDTDTENVKVPETV